MANNHETPTPGERLRAWAEDQEPALQMGILAAQLDVSRTHLSNLVNGRESPSLALAARIERLAGIACRDWSLAPEPTSGPSEDETIDMPTVGR